MSKRYTCVKKIMFVNFWFRQLCQYGGWVCCSNERVNHKGVSYSLPCKTIALFGPLKNVFFLGAKKGRFDPLGKSTPKEHTYHVLDALIDNPRFSR